MNFIRRLNRGNFYFSKRSFKIWWLISGLKVWKHAKFQLNISKIMAVRPKKHWDMGFEYHYKTNLPYTGALGIIAPNLPKQNLLK